MPPPPPSWQPLLGHDADRVRAQLTAGGWGRARGPARLPAAAGRRPPQPIAILGRHRGPHPFFTVAASWTATAASCWFFFGKNHERSCRNFPFFLRADLQPQPFGHGEFRWGYEAKEGAERLFIPLTENRKYDSTRPTSCQESLWAQYLALEKFPNAFRFISHWHSGPGAPVVGSDYRHRVDACLVTKPGQIAFGQYHSDYRHYQGHLESCPAAAAARGGGRGGGDGDGPPFFGRHGVKTSSVKNVFSQSTAAAPAPAAAPSNRGGCGGGSGCGRLGENIFD